MKIRHAMISVSNDDKTPALIEFARALIPLGFNIVSSGGTAKFLSAAGIDVVDVRILTGHPPVLEHKVVTLAPQIHGGLLCSEDQLDELAALKWTKIDLALVTFYPLDKALEAEGATLESCLAQCDIGGPAMIRSANKGGEVIVITSMTQTQPVIDWFWAGEQDRRKVIDALRGKAEKVVAEYIAMSAKIHERFSDLNAASQFGL